MFGRCVAEPEPKSPPIKGQEHHRGRAILSHLSNAGRKPNVDDLFFVFLSQKKSKYDSQFPIFNQSGFHFKIFIWLRSFVLGVMSSTVLIGVRIS